MCLSTFELYIPTDWSIKSNTQAVVPLSAVRTDTYEHVSLDKDQAREVLGAAVAAAAEFDVDWGG